MFGDVSSGIGFDQKIKITRGVIGRDGGIGAEDLFAINRRGKTDVLPDGKAKNVDWSGKGESITTN
jgi:hypothetical protein